MRAETRLWHVYRDLLASRPLDEALWLLAERQHGLVAAWQLAELGHPRQRLADRVAARRLHRVQRGVYAVGHRLLSERGRWMAACLTAGRPAVLSHRSAACLHGLLEQGETAVEVTARTAAQRPGLIRYGNALAADEITFRDRIPVTTPLRTLVDLAAVLDRYALERVVARAEHRGDADRAALDRALRIHRGRRGAAALTRVRDRGYASLGITRSPLEELFLPFLDRYRLRRPELNVLLPLDQEWLEVDGLWRPERVVVELDSRKHHGDWISQERDRARDRKLLARGYEPVRITKREIIEQPAALADELAAILTRRP